MASRGSPLRFEPPIPTDSPQSIRCISFWSVRVSMFSSERKNLFSNLFSTLACLLLPVLRTPESGIWLFHTLPHNPGGDCLECALIASCIQQGEYDVLEDELSQSCVYPNKTSATFFTCRRERKTKWRTLPSTSFFTKVVERKWL